MVRAPFVIVTAVALLVAACAEPNPTGTPQIKDINVFAAASLTDAFTKVYDEYAKSNARVRLIFNFGSSSTLATQITNGAPADLFASADQANMQKIVDAMLTDGTPTAFATNRLEIAVLPGNPKKVSGLADLARSDVILVLAAPTVPVGKYALEALSKTGVSAKPHGNGQHQLPLRIQFGLCPSRSRLSHDPATRRRHSPWRKRAGAGFSGRLVASTARQSNILPRHRNQDQGRDQKVCVPAKSWRFSIRYELLRLI